jgi:hypothetical protein
MKNPKWDKAQEQEIDRAERLSTRATIFELGVGEFLNSHMPCGNDTEEATAVLKLSVDLRRESREIHDRLPAMGRRKPRRK